VHNPWWSPDGLYVVAKKGFTSTRSIPAGEIWLFSLGGGGGLQLTERPNGPKDQKTMADPAFSPDGRYVYYSQDATPGRVWEYNKDSTGQIFVIKRLDRLRGETEVIAGGPGGAVRPVPSPDGKRLAFVKRLPGLTSAIYLMDLTSGKEWSVYDHFERDLQETSGAHGNAPLFAWTPDAGSLVFWSGGTFHRLEVGSKQVATIPVHLKTTMKVQAALRFPVDVAPDTLHVRQVRGAQMSPAGDRVVFNALGRLWVQDVATGARRRLTSQDAAMEQHPAFSRDGKWIVYTTWDDDALGTVQVGSRHRRRGPHRGGSSRRLRGAAVLLRTGPPSSTARSRRAICWLRSASPEPGSTWSPARGGKPTRLTSSGTTPTSGPRGPRLLLDVEEETKLLLKSVNLEGREPPHATVKGGQATEFRVSPDGKVGRLHRGLGRLRRPLHPHRENPWTSPPTPRPVPVRGSPSARGASLHWSGDSRSSAGRTPPRSTPGTSRTPSPSWTGRPRSSPSRWRPAWPSGFDVPADKPKGTIALVGGRAVTMRDADRRRR
jgi:Tol biopolymer transport system component